MSDEMKVNRPQAGPGMATPVESEVSGGGSKTPWIILGFVVVVIVVLGVLFRDKLFGGSSGKTADGKPAMTSKPSGYQAVFLTNGQVYFGKMSSTDSNFATMVDIFYLQVVQPPLQGQQDQNQPAVAQPQPQISLVKLGNELHGPVDEMKINREHILFFEDLRSDGQVVQAINNYKANPPGTTPAAGQPQQ
ncbi:MAG: hypothetical protein AAB410_03540 [Patescibacteria group bacterium]